MMRALVAMAAVLVNLAAQELPAGRVIDRVAAQRDGQQSYALYLPSTYTSARSWPILYCLDPGARGRVPVERFAEAAEKFGFIVAGSNNSRNGPLAPVQEAIQALVEDTTARFSIDPKRVFAAGLSGGARVALAWAENGKIAGVVACSAGFGKPELPRNIPFTVFAAAGFDDFNYHEVYAMSRDLAKRGVSNRFAAFEGGHEWLPASVAAAALAFFSGELAPDPAKDSKEERRQADRFVRLSRELASAEGLDKRSQLELLRKDTGKTEDSADRRLARQVLGNAFIGAMEQGRGLMEAGRYRDAAGVWETAVLVRPENGNAWYSLAVAQAGAGNKKRALEALEHAVANGFQDRERVEREPLLEGVRREGRYGVVWGR
ncbi:MAG: tetratricopeptide repeat protein [Acidobacteriota bacterium]|nr:tetratricopeptide repeat protein [Acidobacteriota bacterium]